MFDTASPHDRMIQATLSLAAEHDWSDVSFTRIAKEADVTLAQARGLFESRSAILKAFSAAVDGQVLNQMSADGDDGDVARDRLFDTLMTRFEILAPYKDALRRLSRGAWSDPALSLELLPSILNGQRWMLEAAGIGTGGASGSARVIGASAIYARVANTWLDDDDAGLAKTMAALDSRLRSGEKTIERFDDACSLLKGFGSMIFSRRRARTTDAKTSDKTADSNDSDSTTDTMEPA